MNIGISTFLIACQIIDKGVGEECLFWKTLQPPNLRLEYSLGIVRAVLVYINQCFLVNL